MKYHPFRNLPLLITGIAVILFSSAGIARIAGWSPVSSGGAGSVPVIDALPAVKGRCAECGVIVSVRDIELRNENGMSGATGETVAGNQNETQVQSTKSHELTIRLADGSSRVINEASPAHWRLGERVIVIDGAHPSDQ
jgi:outer membrane lipoprotein SlyB